MKSDLHQKVTSRHLTRKAFLYIRQSTLHQVTHNTESTRRQYDLQERAIALGWGQEQIVVIDIDQGQSGSSAADRIGFKELITEVGLGHAGLVMGLEVSRLARNSADWHRLLEICALSDTLILDEDGLYAPGHFNDRLLLGLKGTMSEAELHVLRARLQGGLLNKARRGELRMPLPIGFIYDDPSRVVMDPDRQVQEALRNLFATFIRVGSALGTAKHFAKEGLLFPCRSVRGPRVKAPLRWKDLDVSTVLRVLHNPRYAGIYCFGKTRQYKSPEGRHVCLSIPKEDWLVWIPDAHAGYISQQEHEENLRRLAENARAIGAHRRSPPREGPALLQGLVLCGKCGRRMTVHYHLRREELVPSYHCVRKEEKSCQVLHGKTLDEAVGELLVELMSPMTLEVSLSVQQELEQRFEQAEQLRRKQVDRARYEADLTRQRFLLVDPNNRLVAATLEGEWNERLRLLSAAEEEFERRRAEDCKRLGDKQKSAIRSLAGDFSRLWKDPATSDRERKRIARLLIEDVTLRREDRQITGHIRFKAGATRALTVAAPSTAPELFKTDRELVQEIDRLLDDHTEQETAERLNERGLTSARGQSFTPTIIKSIRAAYKLKSRSRRLHEQGYLTQTELAGKLRVGAETLRRWESHDLLRVQHCGWLRFYEDPVTTATPEEVRDHLRAAFRELSTQPTTNEVQYEA